MTVLIHSNPNQITLGDVWRHYEIVKESLDHYFLAVVAGTIKSEQYGSMSLDELKDEADAQACFFLLAAAEAALRVDIRKRCRERKIRQYLKSRHRSLLRKPLTFT